MESIGSYALILVSINRVMEISFEQETCPMQISKCLLERGAEFNHHKLLHKNAQFLLIIFKECLVILKLQRM